MNNLSQISTYHLIYHLLYDGQGNIHPKLEPILVTDIFQELVKRSEEDFGIDIEKWIDWFMLSNKATEKEKTSIKTIKKILDMEHKYLPRIQNKPNN